MNNKFQYGGMAVLEGVMMRGPELTALAVRKSDGTIHLEKEEVTPLLKRFPFLKWPLIRGTYVLIESMVVGVRMLNASANIALEEEEEELSSWEIIITMAISLGLAILLFMVLPTAIVHYTQHYLGGVVLQNIAEGILRIAFFLIYVYFISKMPDIARVFMYHGAEHKTIHTYENGEELTIENARKYSTLHPRCGTAFLLIVMVVSILVFVMLGEGNLFYRIWSRLAVLPVVAGFSYEFLKFSGKYYNHHWLKFMIAPGLWLQNLTTRQPDDKQLEVAITALRAVLHDKENTRGQDTEGFIVSG
ncbi:hypothetical protein ASZ90_017268 [hydrocarbon metagenome]|uniref:DUF1385 domain-containing protein n=1 Tax=hydrocarbon metagenome TaxID=938273 RepID=A0A0W8E9H2_9ZZZZ